LKRNWIIVFLLSIVLGILSYFWPISGVFVFADIIGTLFLKYLKLISLPLIFFSLLSSLSNMVGFQEMKIVGRKICKYTLSTTLVSAIIALLLYLLMNPSKESSLIVNEIQKTNQTHSYLSFLMNIIPDNVISVFLENNVLGVAFLGILSGIGVQYLPQERRKLFQEFFSGIFDILLKITSFVLFFMPIGIWAFVTLLMKDMLDGSASLDRYFLYIFCVVAANIIQAVVVLPLFLKMKGIGPIKTFRGVFPALAMAFFSKSSSATLPLTMDCIQKNSKIDSWTHERYKRV